MPKTPPRMEADEHHDKESDSLPRFKIGVHRVPALQKQEASESVILLEPEASRSSFSSQRLSYSSVKESSSPLEEEVIANSILSPDQEYIFWKAGYIDESDENYIDESGEKKPVPVSTPHSPSRTSPDLNDPLKWKQFILGEAKKIAKELAKNSFIAGRASEPQPEDEIKIDELELLVFEPRTKKGMGSDR